jgi:hypothetical protein
MIALIENQTARADTRIILHVAQRVVGNFGSIPLLHLIFLKLTPRLFVEP